jgi:hypothetical protein
MFPNGLPMSGGVPLFFGHQCVDTIANFVIADQDEVAAQAGVDAMISLA